MGTFFSSGQGIKVLNNNDKALHSEDDACSEDARITKGLSEVAFLYYYITTMTLLNK